MSITLVTDSLVEPVEIADLRDFLRITHAHEDVFLASLVNAARKWCEDVSGRQFVNASWKMSLDSFPTEILLYKLPVSSVTHVKYNDVDDVQQTLVENTDYEVDKLSEPSRIHAWPGLSWPSTNDHYHAVEVQWVAGHGATPGTVPQNYKQAVMILAGHWYENRGLMLVGKAAADVKLTVEALLMEDRVWQF